MPPGAAAATLAPPRGDALLQSSRGDFGRGDCSVRLSLLPSNNAGTRLNLGDDSGLCGQSRWLRLCHCRFGTAWQLSLQAPQTQYMRAVTKAGALGQKDPQGLHE